MNVEVKHTWYMTLRHLRTLARQPWYVAITLVQPIIYLLLFGALFQRVVQLPGFGATSYITFLLPGVVVMTALFSAGWNGMGMIEDLDRGVMDRFLVSPVRRSALITGRVAQVAVVTVIQGAIIVLLGMVRGARFPNGIVGIIVLVLASILLAAPFGALSNGLALVARKEESLIGAVQFVTLPLTFLASVFMAQALMPGWIQSVSAYNPVNWAVVAGREAMSATTDWASVWAHLGYLSAFAVASAWLATRAFRAYQRSV
jgi:ABC-2 type transport system permease protein